MLQTRIVLPLRIGRVLQISGADHPNAALDTRRFHYCTNRGRDIGKQMQWLPVHVRDLADDLRREFRSCGTDQHIGAGVLESDSLTIDGRVRDLVGRGNNLFKAVLEDVLHTGKIVLPKVVVLIKDCDLRLWLGLQDVLRVNLRLRSVTGLPAYSPGMLLVIAPLVRAAADEQMGYLLLVHVFHDG